MLTMWNKMVLVDRYNHGMEDLWNWWASENGLYIYTNNFYVVYWGY